MLRKHIVLAMVLTVNIATINQQIFCNDSHTYELLTQLKTTQSKLAKTLEQEDPKLIDIVRYTTQVLHRRKDQKIWTPTIRNLVFQVADWAINRNLLGECDRQLLQDANTTLSSELLQICEHAINNRSYHRESFMLCVEKAVEIQNNGGLAIVSTQDKKTIDKICHVLRHYRRSKTELKRKKTNYKAIADSLESLKMKGDIPEALGAELTPHLLPGVIESENSSSLANSSPKWDITPPGTPSCKTFDTWIKEFETLHKHPFCSDEQPLFSSVHNSSDDDSQPQKKQKLSTVNYRQPTSLYSAKTSLFETLEQENPEIEDVLKQTILIFELAKQQKTHSKQDRAWSPFVRDAIFQVEDWVSDKNLLSEFDHRLLKEAKTSLSSELLQLCKHYIEHRSYHSEQFIDCVDLIIQMQNDDGLPIAATQDKNTVDTVCETLRKFRTKSKRNSAINAKLESYRDKANALEHVKCKAYTPKILQSGPVAPNPFLGLSESETSSSSGNSPLEWAMESPSTLVNTSLEKPFDVGHAHPFCVDDQSLFPTHKMHDLFEDSELTASPYLIE